MPPTATWSLNFVAKSNIDTDNKSTPTGMVVKPQGKGSARLVGAPSITSKERTKTSFRQPTFDNLEVNPAYNFSDMGSPTIASVNSETSSPPSPGQPLTFAAAPSSGSGIQSNGFPNFIASATTSPGASLVPSSPALDNYPGDGSLTTEVVTTALVTSGVESVIITSTAPKDVLIFTSTASAKGFIFTSTATNEVFTHILTAPDGQVNTFTTTVPEVVDIFTSTTAPKELNIFTSTVLNGEVHVFTSLSSFTRTSTGTTTIVTTRPTAAVLPSAKNNSRSYLGGFIAAALGLLLILVAALCFFRRQRRKRRRTVDASVDPYNMVELSTENLCPPGAQHSYRYAEIGANISSAIPLPSQDTNSGAHHSKRGNRRLSVVTSIPQHNTERDDSNPFQDPKPIEVHEARNALDRLQQLTRDVEIELQNLANQVQSGQLSAAERARLDEIRRTTGLTIMYDSRLRRFLSTSSASSAPPPSYYSDHVPIS